jgi:predicted ATPase
VPDELTDLIVERADGNAFYVEELVKMLIEDGVIETGDVWDPWRIRVERLDPDRVPATLTGVLQTRLDSLAPAERDALQRSSVVGRVFWDGTVAALGHQGIEVAARSLELARTRELVFRRVRSSFDDSVEYTFKHALLRDVTYETVLLRDRQRLHGLVARWIGDHAGERLIEYASLIAAHHRMAGEFAEAAELLRRAAVASVDSGNAAAARRTLDEAFELWREAGQAPPVNAQLTMTEACLRLGDVDAARRHNEESLPRTVTAEERVTALYLASWVASERGERERERATLDEAMPEAETQGGMILVRVLSSLSWCAIISGDTQTATRYAERIRELAEELQHPVASRLMFAALAAVASIDGDNSAALRYSVEALAAATEAGDLEGQTLAHSNIGVCYHLFGDADGSPDNYHAALHHYLQATAINHRLGRWLPNAMNIANMAQVHIRLANDSEAQRLIHEALTAARQSGGTITLMFCVLAEADRRLVNGDSRGGLELIGLVQRHPARTAHNDAEIERILGRSGLASDVIEQGLADGGDDFETTLDRLVQELATAHGAP